MYVSWDAASRSVFCHLLNLTTSLYEDQVVSEQASRISDRFKMRNLCNVFNAVQFQLGRHRETLME